MDLSSQELTGSNFMSPHPLLLFLHSTLTDFTLNISLVIMSRVMKFTIPKYTGTISLIDHFTHFELHLHTLPKKAPELWKLAHGAVFAGLKKAGKAIGYTNNTPVPAIVCPGHPHPAKPHPATVDKDNAWTCSLTPQDFGKLKKEELIPWLPLVTTPCELSFPFVLGSILSLV